MTNNQNHLTISYNGKNADTLPSINLHQFEKEIGSREFTNHIINNAVNSSHTEIAAFKSIRNQGGKIIDFEWLLVHEGGKSTSYYPAQGLIGKRLLEIMPEVHDDLFPIYVRVVESGLSEQLEKVYRIKGHDKYFFITITKVEDGFVTTYADVTTQKRKRALMEERETLLKEAEWLAQMGSWKWTESNDQLHWSNGLYRIFDKNVDEPISWSTFLEDVIPEDRLLMENYLHEVKTNKKGSSIFYRTVKNGCLRYFSLTTKPHAIQDIDILGAVLDITEYKENQQQLEQFSFNQARIIRELDEKENRYRTLFQRSIDPIFLTTDKLIFLNVNNSFIDFMGYDGLEGSSVPLQAIFANTEDFEIFKTTLKRDRQIRDFEVTLETRSGEKKYCLLNCIFISDPVDENCCYQGIIHDLTLRKQAENDMLAAERLSLTGKIARTVAHEVRNPLTNINLALDQLRDEIPTDNDSALLYFDMIERNAARIEELMGEMLNSSKPKKLNLGLMLVSDILEDTLRLAQDRINLNQIRLITNEWDKLPRILVDKDKIQIALLNIMINAIEAMKPGEGILIVNASCQDDTITIQISDNGMGMSPSSLKTLFDPFFTSKERGIGLGLTSTKNILNSHNALIEVTSELNKGTTFYIQFKLAV